MNKQISEAVKNELFREALAAREHAYVPYSGYAVGAAVLTADNRIISGSNVENASYGLSNCAERTAIFRAVSRGYNEFKAIMIVSNGDKPVAPCGACRQVIREFGEDIEVIMTTTDGNTYSRSIGELLPEAFNKGDLSS